MKIYQILLDGKGRFTDTVKERMERKIEWYRERYPDMDVDYREIEVDSEDIGLCFNYDFKMVPKWEGQCSVGLVRVGRSGTRDGIEDDCTCNSCPKFIPYTKLKEIYFDQQSGTGGFLR